MVIIIRIIKDGEVVEESESLHYIYEKLVWYDKKVKEVDITIGRYKDD